MLHSSPPEPQPRQNVDAAPTLTLPIGAVHASSEPLLIKTLVGSCIAVCLFDPVRQVGGMNHFMLPLGTAHELHPDARRFGAQAMDCLIAAMMKAGAHRQRLIAKVFGGAHVLHLPESEIGIPQQNIAFIRAFLGEENITIASEDLGGFVPREVHCYTNTGHVFVRRITGPEGLERVRGQQNEFRALRYGAVTLFRSEEPV
jgi:chemotaxis receptor (MCP) glutamine deamidase CheD